MNLNNFLEELKINVNEIVYLCAKHMIKKRFKDKENH